jgi:hypothetical protein
MYKFKAQEPCTRPRLPAYEYNTTPKVLVQNSEKKNEANGE